MGSSSDTSPYEVTLSHMGTFELPAGYIIL